MQIELIITNIVRLSSDLGGAGLFRNLTKLNHIPYYILLSIKGPFYETTLLYNLEDFLEPGFLKLQFRSFIKYLLTYRGWLNKASLNISKYIMGEMGGTNNY